MSIPAARPSATSRTAITRSSQPSLSLPGNRLRLLVFLAVISSMAATYGSQGQIHVNGNGSCRSRNFMVSAPTTELSRQVCIEAERFRSELAVEWLGKELPPWQDPCPIRVIVGRHLGAGGATSFTFINGQPRDWQMEIQGSRARILDSVLPHEVTHTILATHFGRPLPRWADEGAATSVEHDSERTKQEKLLLQFLTSNRGIAFNQMFAMKEYPRDIMPLYSQGYSLARYLIALGGKRKFLAYVGDGMNWNDWTRATQEHYSMRSLSELQVTWLDWVRRGSPRIESSMSDSAIALVTNTESSSPSAPPVRSRSSAAEVDGLVPLPFPGGNASKDMVDSARGDVSETAAARPGDSWYTRQRDKAMNRSRDTSATAPTGSANTATPQRVGRTLR